MESTKNGLKLSEINAILWLAIGARHCSPAGVKLVSLKPGVLGGAGGGADGHVVLAKDVVLRYVHIVPVLLDDDDHHPDGG